MKTSRTQRDKLLKNLSRAVLVTTPLVIAGVGISGVANAQRGNCPAGSHLDSEGYCMADDSAPVTTGMSYASRTRSSAASYAAYTPATQTMAQPEAVKPHYAKVAQAEGAAHKAKGEAEGAMHKAKGEAEGAIHKAKGEAEGAMHKAKGEAEAEAHKAKGEAEAEAQKAKGEGEAEAEAEGNPSHIVRPHHSAKYRGGLSKKALIARGKELYADETLSTNGLSCNSCHTDMEGYNATFKKRYPHYVAMGKDIYGQRKISAETMVQLCMEQPMEASPLPWDSEKLAALTAYVKTVRKAYKKSGKWKGAAEGEGEAQKEAKGEAEH